MKKTLSFLSVLVLTALTHYTFADTDKTNIPNLKENVEIHSKSGLSEGNEAGSPPIVASRSVTLKVGQYLDITYPGTGWIYLGEVEGSSLLKYEKREIGDGDTFFTLQTKAAGTTILHFYKSDALAGSYIDDYLSVTISGSSRNAEHIKAPLYADIVPPRPSFTKSEAVASFQQEKEQKSSSSNTSSAKASDGSETATIRYVQREEENISSDDDKAATVIQTSDGSKTTESSSSQEKTSKATKEASISKSAAKEEDKSTNDIGDTSTLSEGEILELARKAYESKDYKLSLSYLEAFFDKAETLTDDGLFLKGKILEAPSSSRNIKEALTSYKTIVSHYPESDLWDDASKRINYIERIYFDIR